jgi:hypothetical protein
LVRKRLRDADLVSVEGAYHAAANDQYSDELAAKLQRHAEHRAGGSEVSGHVVVGL